MDYSPPTSSVLGISLARILEWVAIFFSRGSSWLRDQTHVSCLSSGFFTTDPPGKHSLSDTYIYSLKHIKLSFCEVILEIKRWVYFQVGKCRFLKTLSALDSNLCKNSGGEKGFPRSMCPHSLRWDILSFLTVSATLPWRVTQASCRHVLASLYQLEVWLMK